MNELFRLFALIALLLITQSASIAQGKSSQPPAGFTPNPKPSLIVADEKGLETMGGGWRWNFGEIDRLAVPSVVHLFTLRNTGSEEFVIDHIQPSCGCTSTLLTGTDKGEKGFALAPGSQVILKVSLELSHLIAGNVQKFLWVYKAGSVAPALTIELDAKVDAPLSFSPAVLDFGRNTAGVPRSLPLLVSMDKRLAESGLPFQLVCSNPGIKIETREGDIVGADKSAKQQIKAYTITISSDANLGILAGTLSFMVPQSNPGPAANSLTTLNQANATVLLTTSIASLSGEVVGNVSASPGTVVFGVVNAGQPTPRRITLIGVTESALRNLTVSTVTDWVSARLLPIEKRSVPVSSSNPPVRLLEISLTPNAPPGSLQTQVIVTTQEGKRLVLPILATINKSTL